MARIHVNRIFEQLGLKRRFACGLRSMTACRMTSDCPKDRRSVRHIRDQNGFAAYLVINAFLQRRPGAYEDFGL